MVIWRRDRLDVAHGRGCLQRLGQTGVLGGGEPCRPKHVAIPVPVTWRLTMQINEHYP